MMYRLWLLLLVPSLVQASDVAVCDPLDSDVPNRVVLYRRSVNDPEWVAVPNSILNPDISAITEPKIRYWKCSGSALIDMTAQEKADLDADQIAQDAQDATDNTELQSLKAELRTAWQDRATLTPNEKANACMKGLRVLILRERLDRRDAE
jgi:hypothetical protein